MNDEAREIASKLSKTQQRLVRTGQGSHEDAVSSLVFPLWSTIIKDKGHFHIVLNREGLAVRRALETQS
jgi:hypothetical protein